jgi:hypothetical protein
MTRKSILCPCGAEFPLAEIRTRDLHCPKCGEAIWFESGDADGRIPGNGEIRERPLAPPAPRRLLHPRILPAAAGLLIAGSLLLLIVSFSRRKPADTVGRAGPAPRSDDSARLLRPSVPGRPERKPDPPPAPPVCRVRRTPSS